jgi:hypothetical protein
MMAGKKCRKIGGVHGLEVGYGAAEEILSVVFMRESHHPDDDVEVSWGMKKFRRLGA